MRIDYYINLIELFLQDKLSAEEFKHTYIKSLKNETHFFGQPLFPILQDLFEDADSYSPIWSEEDESTSTWRITEPILRQEALDALNKLKEHC